MIPFSSPYVACKHSYSYVYSEIYLLNVWGSIGEINAPFCVMWTQGRILDRQPNVSCMISAGLSHYQEFVNTSVFVLLSLIWTLDPNPYHNTYLNPNSR